MWMLACSPTDDLDTENNPYLNTPSISALDISSEVDLGNRSEDGSLDIKATFSNLISGVVNVVLLPISNTPTTFELHETIELEGSSMNESFDIPSDAASGVYTLQIYVANQIGVRAPIITETIEIISDDQPEIDLITPDDDVELEATEDEPVVDFDIEFEASAVHGIASIEITVEGVTGSVDGPAIKIFRYAVPGNELDSFSNYQGKFTYDPGDELEEGFDFDEGDYILTIKVVDKNGNFSIQQIEVELVDET